jgi:Ca-activated chloride channel homolog
MKNTLLFVFALMVSMQIISQEKKITGTILDSSGMPLPGVNVVVKGSANGTQSDLDGNYEILAQLADVLTFTYIGFISVEHTVGSSNNINVSMQEDASALDEVVVTAHGIRIRGYNSSGYTPSVAQLRRQRQKAYHKSITRTLSGKVSGIQIAKQNGIVGAATEINIRGNTLIQEKKQPLYIVDGVPIRQQYNAVIQNINSKDIDYVNVYKGRKAKELFGDSAKNGCIVIYTKQGNYRIENDEAYAQIDENKFERVSLSPLSTFSIDVDKASYSNIRRMINNGQKIPFDAVKIEEMVNYFDYNYPQPDNEHPFSINTEVATTPWNKETKIVKIGLQGKIYANEKLPASNLTFLIDVSGSMSSQNKLPLLKSAFKLLVNQLREKDKVSIVVYAGAAGVVLYPTSGNNKEKIIAALDNLNSGGSTAGGAGIKLAYKLAEKNFKKNGNNRVILATDGDFNVGVSSNKAMETLIKDKRKSGVFLSVLGFGYGNYKDSKLEILADKGNGNHAYIDNMQEAQKVFGKEFGGTLYTIAKDVKIQVEFNPAKVQAYRLIGYENRLLEDEDFIDDTKDAGELGSGHTVTALYEMIPLGANSDYLKDVSDLKYTKNEASNSYSEELFTVKFRYKKPDANKSIEMVHVQKDEVNEASRDLQFSASVALFGMQLRQSKYDNKSTLKEVITLAENGRGKDKDGYRAEFIRLVKSYNK